MARGLLNLGVPGEAAPMPVPWGLLYTHSMVRFSWEGRGIVTLLLNWGQGKEVCPSLQKAEQGFKPRTG